MILAALHAIFSFAWPVLFSQFSIREKDYGRSLIIFHASSAANAFMVSVLTFPAEPTFSIRDITISSLGASTIITTSYSPKV